MEVILSVVPRPRDEVEGAGATRSPPSQNAALPPRPVIPRTTKSVRDFRSREDVSRAVRMGSTGRWPVAFGGPPSASELKLDLPITNHVIGSAAGSAAGTFAWTRKTASHRCSPQGGGGSRRQITGPWDQTSLQWRPSFMGTLHPATPGWSFPFPSPAAKTRN
jgi:hypothetical protein